METNTGWLIVLDADDCIVRLDLTVHTVKTENRLIVQSVPAGLHYLSEGVINTLIPGLWFDLKPGEVVGYTFKESQERYEKLSEATLTEYKKLIFRGAEIENLKNYVRHRDVDNEDRWLAWKKITKHLKLDSIPMNVHPNEAAEPPTNLSLEERQKWLSQQPTRFEKIFFNTHQGDIKKFLAELEYVFIHQQYTYYDSQALKRWEFIIQALYNAGERGILKAPELFVSAVEILMVQFALTFDAKLKPDYVAMPAIAMRVPLDVVTGADNLVEDMIDSEIEAVVEKGKEFEAYLKRRGILS